MTQKTAQPPRVLVADDDHSIRKLLGTIITREQLPVDLAADGAEAIERLKERDYAVILLDLMMPNVDGFGVVEHLRKHPPAQKPVILVITAYADQKFRDIDPELVAGIIRKPFEVADVGALVRLCAQGIETARRFSNPGDETVRVLPAGTFAKLEALRAEGDDHEVN